MIVVDLMAWGRQTSTSLGGAAIEGVPRHAAP